jgi:hypothetical protein
MVSCLKQSPVEEPTDKWNGYFDKYKTGETIHTLWAGAGGNDTITKGINIGTVTYGVKECDEEGHALFGEPCFYATYQTNSEWIMTEAHMYCGDFVLMPLNKKGKTPPFEYTPKIGRFTHNESFGSGVHEVTFWHLLTDLPCADISVCPGEDAGFTVAAHAAVVKVNSGQGETAWAAGDNVFGDRRWGWFDMFTYDDTEDNGRPPVSWIYAIEYDMDILTVYRVYTDEVNAGTIDVAFTEDLNLGDNVVFDGAAVDDASNSFYFVYFTDVNNAKLMVISLEDDTASVNLGDLSGVPTSATFYDGAFYYVDSTTNTIEKVEFNVDGSVGTITPMATVPGNVTVNDIAINPLDNNLYEIYIIAVTSDNSVELIKYDVSTTEFTSVPLTTINETAQITFCGNDLYVIQDNMDPANPRLQAYKINPITGQIIDDVVDNDVGGGRGTRTSDVAGTIPL